MSKSSLFPDSYSPWLAQRLPGEISESLATCDSCAMVEPKGLTRDPGPFKVNLKCCTYFPFIPNFSLGAMLDDLGAVASVRLRSAAHDGLLLPLGLFASPERERAAKKAGNKGFGKRRDLLCPFFDSVANGCSVWRHRPAVCTTYFCRSERDEVGFEFWDDVESYLNHFEWTLANEILARLDFDESIIENCEAVMLEDEPGPERDWLVKSVWGTWADREEEFFHQCKLSALKITPNELSSLLGDEALELEESLRARTLTSRS